MMDTIYTKFLVSRLPKGTELGEARDDYTD